jgi:hypothetical protein
MVSMPVSSDSIEVAQAPTAVRIWPEADKRSIFTYAGIVLMKVSAKMSFCSLLFVLGLVWIWPGVVCLKKICADRFEKSGSCRNKVAITE